MTYREIVRLVRLKMARSDMSKYQLHRKLSRKTSKQTVYNFVEHGKVVRTDNLLAILDAVDLSLILKDKSHAKR
jgi:hypothetical protein